MESRMTVHEDGTKAWFNENGQLHREDGPAIVWVEGFEWWYQNGNRHRKDGPAVIRPTGSKVWYRHGRFHREDGPAVIDSNGDTQWWLNDREYTFKIWANELNLDQKTRLEMVMKWNPD